MCHVCERCVRRASRRCCRCLTPFAGWRCELRRGMIRYPNTAQGEFSRVYHSYVACVGKSSSKLPCETYDTGVVGCLSATWYVTSVETSSTCTSSSLLGISERFRVLVWEVLHPCRTARLVQCTSLRTDMSVGREAVSACARLGGCTFSRLREELRFGKCNKLGVFGGIMQEIRPAVW